MSYPLVRELAEDAIPVTVTCRVLQIARQPYYRWLANSVTSVELDQAYRANALFDAHRDDPEFGYRYLLDEARDAGQSMAARTAWRICSDNGWWSARTRPIDPDRVRDNHDHVSNSGCVTNHGHLSVQQTREHLHPPFYAVENPPIVSVSGANPTLVTARLMIGDVACWIGLR